MTVLLPQSVGSTVACLAWLLHAQPVWGGDCVGSVATGSAAGCMLLSFRDSVPNTREGSVNTHKTHMLKTHHYTINHHTRKQHLHGAIPPGNTTRKLYHQEATRIASSTNGKQYSNKTSQSITAPHLHIGVPWLQYPLLLRDLSTLHPCQQLLEVADLALEHVGLRKQGGVLPLQTVEFSLRGGGSACADMHAQCMIPPSVYMPASVHTHMRMYAAVDRGSDETRQRGKKCRCSWGEKGTSGWGLSWGQLRVWWWWAGVVGGPLGH